MMDLFSNDLDEKPKILLMGLRRSGKSSIQKVVFHKMAPNETLYLESTNKIEKNDVSDCSFIKFQIWDFPGHIDFRDTLFQSDIIFTASCALIFVIDAQDDYLDALARLNSTIDYFYRRNSNMKFEVFIHKVDCLQDDQKIEVQRDITQRVTSVLDDLVYAHCEPRSVVSGGGPAISISFHLTTIYDHSIFEAFSKVVQKLIPYSDAFEDLLNIFISNSMLDKAFLFDVATKTYLATDSTIVDMQTYELCCDMIDVVVDIASIYTPHTDLNDPPFSEQTAATIVLNNDTVLYLRGVNKYMALVCLLREESLEKMGIIDYNYQIVKSGLQKMLNINQKEIKSQMASPSSLLSHRSSQVTSTDKEQIWSSIPRSHSHENIN